ncbi:MAG: hypothetical protein H7249_15435 [Chitinophagaceae bacterium]|nr:hypothetical protein [Oligoflexus sp.]
MTKNYSSLTFSTFTLLLAYLSASACKPIGSDSELHTLPAPTQVASAADDCAKERDPGQHPCQTLTPQQHVIPVSQGLGGTFRLSDYWRGALDIDRPSVTRLSKGIFVDNTSIFFSSDANPRIPEDHQKLIDKFIAKINSGEAVTADEMWTASEAKRLLELDKKNGFRAKAATWFKMAKDKGVSGTLQTAKQDVKEFWNKTEKIRISTNLETIIDSYTSSIEFWISGTMLKKNFHPNGKHTLSIKIEATQKDAADSFVSLGNSPSIDASATAVTKGAVSEIVKLTVSALGVSINDFFTSIPPGGTLVESGKTTGLKLPIPNLAAKIPLAGYPGAGVFAEFTAKVTGSFRYGIAARIKGVLSLSAAPTLALITSAGIGAEAAILKAKVLGSLTVFELSWPITAHVGGSRSKILYGGVTYDGQKFDFLKGKISLQLSAVLPQPIKFIFYLISMAVIDGAKYPTLKKALSGYDWVYDLWAPADPFKNKNLPGAPIAEFYHVTSKGKTDCNAVHKLMRMHAMASQNQHDVTYQQNGKDGYYPKELQVAFTKMLERLAVPIQKSCPADPAFIALTTHIPTAATP